MLGHFLFHEGELHFGGIDVDQLVEIITSERFGFHAAHPGVEVLFGIGDVDELAIKRNRVLDAVDREDAGDDVMAVFGQGLFEFADIAVENPVTVVEFNDFLDRVRPAEVPAGLDRGVGHSGGGDDQSGFAVFHLVGEDHG